MPPEAAGGGWATPVPSEVVAQCWGEGLGGPGICLMGAPGFTWLIPHRVPHQCRDRGVATLGQVCKVHSVERLKKYTTRAASRAGPRQRPAQGTTAFSLRGVVPSSPGSRGPWSSGGRGTGAPMAWFFGTVAGQAGAVLLVPPGRPRPGWR